MKRTIITILALLAVPLTAWAADQQKTFTVTVEPEDAVIRVTLATGSKEKEQVYRSPASITAVVPEDRMMARKVVLDISHEQYKSLIIPIGGIREGEAVKVKLEKNTHKLASFRMTSPADSNDIRIKDERVTIELEFEQAGIRFNLTNHTTRPVKILWQRAVYTDGGQQHRIMHSGMRYHERSYALPFQSVMPYITVHQILYPVDMVYLNKQNKMESRPLFPILVGAKPQTRDLELIIPVEIEYVMVPYTFKIRMQTYGD